MNIKQKNAFADLSLGEGIIKAVPIFSKQAVHNWTTEQLK